MSASNDKNLVQKTLSPPKTHSFPALNNNRCIKVIVTSTNGGKPLISQRKISQNSYFAQNHTAVEQERKASESIEATGLTAVPGVQNLYCKCDRLACCSRHPSHTLLYLPEQRRVSTISNYSVTSCPTELMEDAEVAKVLQRLPSSSTGTLRRTSFQTGASPSSQHSSRHASRTALIDGHKEGYQRGSEPLLSDRAENTEFHTESPRPKILTKRVSWLLMKNLDETSETSGTSPKRGDGKRLCDDPTESALRSDSRTSYSGSSQLLDNMSQLERDDDTPPLDTMSWRSPGLILRNCCSKNNHRLLF